MRKIPEKLYLKTCQGDEIKFWKQCYEKYLNLLSDFYIYSQNLIPPANLGRFL